MANNGKGRTRNWCCIVYPESLPNDWRDRMDRQLVPWIESPMHDLDLYDERFDYDNDPVGDRKKEHFHLMIMFDTVKDENQLLNAFDFLNIKHFQRVNSTKGYYRYMFHDPVLYPDKHPYSQDDVVFHMGARLEDVLQPSPGEVNEYYYQILHWIDLNDIREISTVQRYIFENGLQEWMYVINRKSLLLYQYLKSKQQLQGKIEKIKFDYNGETIDNG